jgi:CubicO group peptidase (beta-lactamase class C family)
MPDLYAEPQADLANWRTKPVMAWAFRNIPAILPVAAIAHDPARIRALPAAPRPLDGFRLRLGGEDFDLAAFLAATATDGMLVLHEGRIAFETYANGLDAATPHILMSATKSVTGLLAGILVDAGALDVEAPVTLYLPELAHTAYAGATLQDLLDMRTGIALDPAHASAYDAAAHWSPVPPGTQRQSLHEFFATLDLPPARHGGAFRYVSANTDLLGLVIERATGEGVAALLSRLLWQRMGAGQPAFITTDIAGTPRCTGGLCATLRDFARIGQVVAEDGAGIVPARWIADMAENGDRAAWRAGEWGTLSPRMRYRDYWYVGEGAHAGETLLFAMGIHGQALFVDRAHRLVVARFASQEKGTDYRAMALAQLAVTELRRLFG